MSAIERKRKTSNSAAAVAEKSQTLMAIPLQQTSTSTTIAEAGISAKAQPQTVKPPRRTTATVDETELSEGEILSDDDEEEGMAE